MALAKHILVIGAGDGQRLQAVLMYLGHWDAHRKAVKLSDKVLELAK